MKIYFYVMIFQSKPGTRKFHWESTMSVRFITDLKTPLHLIVAVYIWIYPPCILVIIPYQKRSRYTPDILPDAIYVISINYAITFTKPYEPPQVIILSYYVTSAYHTIIIYKPGHAMEKKDTVIGSMKE